MKTTPFLVPLLCVLTSGCASLFTEQQQTAELQSYQISALKAEVSRLKEQVSAMDRAQQEIFQRLQTTSTGDQAELRDLKASVSRLEQTVSTLEASRTQDRQEIANSVARRMADVMKSQPTGRTGSSTSESGYEHTVQAGQTLSEIAAAYKVSVSAIMKANNISKPEALRVGQKLFIPEASPGKSATGPSRRGGR
jgi:LysM repeat protein